MSTLLTKRSRWLAGLMSAVLATISSTPVDSATAESTPLSTPACSTQSSLPAVLVVWHGQSYDGEAFLQRAEVEFEIDHPGVDVQLKAMGSPEEMVDSLRSGAHRPDVIITGSEVLTNLNDSGLVTPASECIKDDPDFAPDDLLRAAAATYEIDGELIGIPVLVSTPVLYFDQTRFRAAGLDPAKPPRTMAELSDALARLRQLPGVADGLVSANAEWFVTAWAADLDLTLGGVGNGHVPGGARSIDLTAQSLVDRLEVLAQMAADGLVADVDGAAFGDLLRLVDPDAAAGVVAHTSGSMRYVYELIDQGSLGNVVLGIAPFPDTTNATVVGGSAAWLVASSPAAKASGWEFIRMLADTQHQAQVGALGYAPSRRSSLSDETLQSEWLRRPGLKTVADIIVNGDDAEAGISGGTGDHIAWRLNWACEDILRGRSIELALQEATLDIDFLLATYHELR